ncbi:MAG: DEAD/DEAH box helicase [Erysipelotrichaceae bacterium]|nr:DEAD/DEAH box helicase [Erysipelotrichaceae bacterium]
MTEFRIDQLRHETYEALKKMGISELSGIQGSCIPAALEGKDIYACAPTGTGKTIAYLAPVLEHTEQQMKTKHKPIAVILSPTRELASQIADVSRKLLSTREGIRTALLTGGIDMNRQVRSFRNSADIIVGTPARICDHLRRHTIKTDEIRYLIIDEADEMLSMGFYEDVMNVVNALAGCQIMLFTATDTAQTRKLASEILKNPAEFRIGSDPLLRHRIRLYHCICKEDEKPAVLKELLYQNEAPQILIFCGMRNTCDRVSSMLGSLGYSCDTVHSEMDPNVRKRIMRSFKDHRLRILTATDVAARGIDIIDIGLVINYDCPQDIRSFVHRIGRTGRSNTEGTVISLFTEKELPVLSVMQKETGLSSEKIELRTNRRFERK